MRPVSFRRLKVVLNIGSFWNLIPMGCRMMTNKKMQNPKRIKQKRNQYTSSGSKYSWVGVPHGVPQKLPTRTIQVDSGGLDNLPDGAEKQKKPQEKLVSLELSSVGLTGFEPAISTPPV